MHAYRAGQKIPGYAEPIHKSVIEAEDFNCNIRRYVDNAPPPEPQDVRAHLHGGVPIAEVDSLDRYWSNYPQLRDDCFVPRDASYVDFAPVLNGKRAIAELVARHQGVTGAHETFMKRLEDWWQDNFPIVEALAPDPMNQSETAGNVYAMRRAMLMSIEEALAEQSLLTPFQVRGAFAKYVDHLKADFKSIAASGWGPELIPVEDILQSQFPEVLEELKRAQARLVELQALFAAAGEEDFEDTDDSGVLPSDEVKGKKAELKNATAEWKSELKKIKALATNLFVELKAADLLPHAASKAYYCSEGFAQNDPAFDNGKRILALAEQAEHVSEYAAPLAEAIAQGRLAYDLATSLDHALERHKQLEDEVKGLKATIKGIEIKRDELVAKARENISEDQARVVIVARLRRILMETYAAYLRADQRACIKALENLWAKYAVTAKSIEKARDAATAQLQQFLVELGYE